MKQHFKAHTQQVFGLAGGALILAMLWLGSGPALCDAQVSTSITPTPPGAGGLGTTVTQTGQTYNIGGGARPGNGPNLFHSFGEFSIGAPDIANFVNETPALPTSNILSRVTGGSPSNIFGTIQTTEFPGANFFLMNPAGIVFGSTAQLNVGGAVNFTTADYLRLADQNGNAGIFYASSLQSSVLSMAPVAAFGFLSTTPAPIAVQGSSLFLPPGETLALVGGDLTIGADSETGASSFIQTPGGQVQMVSVSSPGEVLLPTLSFGPNINGQSFTKLGTVTIRDFTFMDLSDSGFLVDGHGGSIAIRGGRLVVDSAFILADTSGDVDGANPAFSVTMSDKVQIGASFIGSNTFGNGRSGDIEIAAAQVEVTSGSLVVTGTGGQGPAGDIRVTATDSILVTGIDQFGNTSRFESTATGDTGSAGNLFVQAPSVTVSEGGIIRGLSLSLAPVGDVTLRVGDLTITGGGIVGVSGGSKTGLISVLADGSITITGAPPEIGQSQISNASNGTGGTGPQGGISIQTRALTIDDGGRVRSDADNVEGGGISIAATEAISVGTQSKIVTRSGSKDVAPISLSAPSIILDNGIVQSLTVGTGKAGNVTVNTTQLSILSGGQITTVSQQGSGRGGDVALSVIDKLLVHGQGLDDFGQLGPSAIRTGNQNLATGDAGHITVSAGNVELSAGGRIDSSTVGSGSGGSVSVQGAGGAGTSAASLLLSGSMTTGQSSGIFTNTTGTGPGGNIAIDAESVTLQNFGTLSAATSGTAASATGGKITVAANDLQLTGRSLITAQTTGPGNAGSVSMTADTVSFTGGGQINTGTSSSGQGGPVAVMANNSILISGDSPIPVRQSGLLSTTSGEGNAGNISLTAPEVTLQNQARLSTSAGEESSGQGGNIQIQGAVVTLEGRSNILSTTQGAGAAGTIRIIGDEGISLIDSTISSNSTSFTDPAGNGGLIWLTSPNLTLSNGRLNAITFSSGNAGSVLIEVNQLALEQSDVGGQSQISTSTQGAGNAGNIVIRGLAGPGSRAQDIIVSQESQILSGTDSGAEGNGGSIDIETARLTLTDGSLLATSSTFALGHAGNIAINADDTVQVSSLSTIQSVSDLSEGNAGQITITAPNLILDTQGFITTSTNGTGNAGSIFVKTNTLTLASGGQLTSGSNLNDPDFPPTGAAGNVTVQGLASPAQSVLIDGPGSGIFTDTQGEGVGGNISIDGQTVTVQNSGMLSAATSGTAASATGGTITMTANSFQVSSQGLVTSATSGPGNAGNVLVTAETATFASGGQMQANTSGSGLGGSVTLTNSGPVSLSGSGTAISSAASGSGHGGAIAIQGGVLTLNDNAGVSAASTGTGNAGTVTLQGSGNYVMNGGTVSTSATQGAGGNIHVNAGQQVQMSNGAVISASSTGPGDAGNIGVTAGDSIFLTSSTIKAEAMQASGGDITLTAPNTIHLTNSTVSTSVGGDVTTSGGNIIIDPQFVILQNSQIIAQAVQGAGGNITIVAGVLLVDGTSIIDASSQFGTSGTVNIQSPVSALSQVVNPLSRSTLQATGLLMERCAVRMQELGGVGSLTVRGREVAPTAPAGMLSGPLLSLTPSPAASGASPMTIPSIVPTPRLQQITGRLIQPMAEFQFGACGS